MNLIKKLIKILFIDFLKRIILMDLLVDDIYSQLLRFIDHEVTLIILLFVNKRFHKICSNYGKINKINRILKCYNIAALGYLNILIWARQNNYQWNFNTCAYAAQNGHLE